MNPSNKAELAKALPSPEQEEWVEQTQAKIRANRRFPLKLKATPHSSVPLEVATPNNTTVNCQLYQATGFTDWDAASAVMNQVTNLNGSSSDAGKANALLAMLDGLAPENPLEGLLAAQMTACHNMTMEFSRRATAANQSSEVTDLNINRATKLMRTFTAQVEALQKIRNKGQQKITVQHVQVGQGGQAIIGDVSHGGGLKG